MINETVTLSQQECLKLIEKFGQSIPKSILNKINPIATQYNNTKKYWDFAEEAKRIIFFKHDDIKNIRVNIVELPDENKHYDAIQIPKNCIGIYFEINHYGNFYYVHWNYNDKIVAYEHKII